MGDFGILKRVVVKEELVAVCGDHTTALILNQFLYWQVRKRDTIKYLQEEIERRRRGGLSVEGLSMTNDGWIYKSAGELKNELMLASSENTILRRIETLVEMGFLGQRSNPYYKWDRTYQYRVDLNKLALELSKKEYTIETVIDGGCKYKGMISTFTLECCNKQNGDSQEQNVDVDLFNEATIPETTTEITNKDIKELTVNEKVRKLITTFSDLHKRESKGKKIAITGTIVSQMKRLIKIHDLQDVQENLEKYYDYDFWFTKNGGRTFFSFVKRYDELVTAKGKKRAIEKASGDFTQDYNNYMNGV